MKHILCFGDSNTWGFIPTIFDYETFHMERYSRDLRWPGFMQNLLGNDYFVIEEGLNGRTTNVEYPDIQGRSGTSYLEPCLYTHSPLDLVIILLGVNDLKVIFDLNKGKYPQKCKFVLNTMINQFHDEVKQLMEEEKELTNALSMCQDAKTMLKLLED